MADRMAITSTANPAGDSLPTDEQLYQELKKLLLSAEQEELLALKERIENARHRAEDVSEVLVEAILARREKGGGPALREALAPSVEEALRSSVRRDPQTLADALFPVMGPAIRRSILETIRSMLEAFNEAMDRSLSWQGILWRMESLRTGRPFSEVVLLHSLEYRVEQVFLIHRKTSLLLQQVVASEVAAQDADMVSSMLSAIQDFVRDSFHTQQGEVLDFLQHGELQIWVEPGPHAILAAVLRGHPPQSFRLRMKQALEKIHQQLLTALEEFDGNAAAFAAAHDDLSALLETHYRETTRRRPRPFFTYLVVVLVALLATWKFLDVREDRKWERFVDTLRLQQGIQVLDFRESGEVYRIEGMRDPLSVEPTALLEQSGLDPNRALFLWRPYYALDDELVQKRAVQILQPPGNVILSVKLGTLVVAGVSPRGGWGRRLRERGPVIPGVKLLDLREFDDGDTLDYQRARVETLMFFFELGSAEIPSDQTPKFEQARAMLKNLTDKAAMLGVSTTVEIVGHTDSTGPDTANALLSQMRAARVQRELLAAGVPARALRVRGVGFSEPFRRELADEDRRYNRRVTFRVTASPGALSAP
jgi:OOP family OmpA-OmpF porin